MELRHRAVSSFGGRSGEGSGDARATGIRTQNSLNQISLRRMNQGTIGAS